MEASPQRATSGHILTVRVRERTLAVSRKFRFRLTDRLFFLHLLLAWQRRAHEVSDDGYVGCDVIRRLPYWEKNSLLSVGKQVRRLLDVPLSQGPGRRRDAPALYGFVQAICQGNAAFDAGALDAARGAYEAALKEAFTPEQTVTALQKVGRVLERQARYDRARTLFARALRLRRRHPELDDSTAARTHLFLGWLEYPRGKYTRARDHYHHAMDLARGKRDDWLLGHLYNALGLIAKRGDDYEEALALFRTALDHWCRADYAYGIAAAYANIGTTHARWGNHLRDHRMGNQARVQYRRAEEWLGRCLELSARARLGEDTSQAQAMLAEVYLELGDVGQAWSWARAAREAAEKAGNELDLASATFILGRLHVKRAELDQGRRLLSEAESRFERLGHPDRAREIGRWLSGLGAP